MAKEKILPMIVMGSFEPSLITGWRSWWIVYYDKNINFMCHGNKGGLNAARAAAKQMKAVLKTNPKIYKKSEVDIVCKWKLPLACAQNKGL